MADLIIHYVTGDIETIPDVDSTELNSSGVLLRLKRRRYNGSITEVFQTIVLTNVLSFRWGK